MTATMKAVVHDRYGGPEVLRVETVPRPVPDDDEVLVRVHAAAINRTDAGFRTASPFINRFFSGLLRPKYRVLGTEFAGVVVATGASVTTFAIDERVFGVNVGEFGTHAEYVCVKAARPIATMPDSMTFEEGAGLCDGVVLALTYLRKVGLGPQHRIMVYGASGSIGTAGVQLAKQMGAHVTAVCSTATLELVRSLGADEVIDYQTGDFLRSDTPYDYVFDAVGKLSLRRVSPVLKRGGTCGRRSRCGRVRTGWCKLTATSSQQARR